jgi:DNA-binding GntR family transcriptional regulator
VIDELAGDRSLLGQSSRAERVADVLRARIASGFFRPGEKLLEDEITEALAVSRNTLREAFRLLGHERLLVHQLNRGVFVRRLDVADVRDLYRVRAHVEVSVVARFSGGALDAVEAAVVDGERAMADRDWQALGTANIAFHQALVGLARSPRLDELMRGLLAELRLVFHVMDDPERFHSRYLARNREIVGLLSAGDGAEAARVLAAYLADAEEQLVTAYEEIA